MDDTIVSASLASGLDFDESPGNLDIWNFAMHVMRPDQIRFSDFLTVQPGFDFESTVLRFNDVPTSLPVDPGNLKSFDVYPFTLQASALFFSTPASTPWLFGAWVRCGLATDFRIIGEDDLTADVAIGTGYRFSQSLSVGIGAGAMNLPASQDLIPGFGVDWQINDSVGIHVCGPTWAIIRTLGSDWRLGLKGELDSKVWNITDDQGKSRFINLDSYHISLVTTYRWKERFHLTASVGLALSNEISLTRSEGDVLLKQGTGNGLFIQMGVSVFEW